MMTKNNIVFLSVSVTKKKWSTVWFVYYTDSARKCEVARFLGKGDAYSWVKEKRESIERQALPIVKEIIIEYGK